MNTQNAENRPAVKKDTKKKIRVDFDRTPLKQRLKEKYLTFNFAKKVAVNIFRYVLMIGIAYVILRPLLFWFLDSIKSAVEFNGGYGDMILPQNVSFALYRAIFTEAKFFEALGNTFMLSLTVALLQMLVCCLIGYGFAKFKFRGRNLIFLLVMLTMIIPHQTLRASMDQQFRNFDILGIVRLFKGGGIEFFGWNVKSIGPGVAEFFENLNLLPDQIQVGLNASSVIEIRESGLLLTNTYLPLMIMSVTGLAFKNGLYIFLLRQFFRGIPDELEESAYMDGCGTFRTFFQVILPLSIPMMVTVFLFAFCWQWTDNFYVRYLVNSVADIDPTSRQLSQAYNQITGNSLPNSLQVIVSQTGKGLSVDAYTIPYKTTFALMTVAPLVILYAFCQNFLVQGIEHSGIAN
ncbi:MAG: carbohydrate ABC transporter permease [Clostridia bacterium]|nr:carbohydrate ABC transporter permease [Clostridia bacterium]MBQ9773578.1 carbohydrate ABC transporter permease [Clostridia bacterium]